MVTNRLLPNQFPSMSQVRHENCACQRFAQSLSTPSGDLLIEAETTRQPARFRSVLVPLDGTTHGERALPLAVSIAKNARAKLRLLHVYAPIQGDFYPQAYSGIDGDLYQRQLDYVRRVARKVGEAAEISVIPQCVRRQNIVQAICDVASRSVDLVVASTHGHSLLQRVWNGSTVHQLVDTLSVPVLVLRGDGLRAAITHEHWLRRLLVPLDGLQQPEHVLDSATVLGSLFEADYSLLTIVPRSRLGLSTWHDEDVQEKQAAAQEYLLQAARRMTRRGQKSLRHVEVTRESVANAIVKRAESSRADCIAMARDGRESLCRWLQPSVTHRVLEIAQVPILVLPTDARRNLHYERSHLQRFD